MKGREGYFNVDPVLTVRKRNPILSDELKALSPSAGGGAITSEDIKIPMDGLAVLTAVSKWMGPLTEWAPHLREASERGYNMIHWTPLQQRGESKSPYSIADQLAFDEALFKEGWKGTKEEGVKHVAQMMKTAKEEYGLLSLIDVVLNHTANNSAWLVDHPEAGYSPYNSAHLTPALELDDAIMDFSEQVGERGLPTTVTSEADLKTLIDALKEDIKALNLWQYYVIDVISEKEAVKAVLDSGTPAPWDGPAVAGKTVVELALILKESGKLENFGAFSKRFCTTVDPAVGASLVSAAFVELKDADALAEAWGKVLDVINVDQYKEWEDDTKVAIDNVFNRLKYTRWDEHGPKLGPITRE